VKAHGSNDLDDFGGGDDEDDEEIATEEATPYGDATTFHQVQDMDAELLAPTAPATAPASKSPSGSKSATPRGRIVPKALKIDESSLNNSPSAANSSPNASGLTPRSPSGLTRSKSASQLTTAKTPKTPKTPSAAELDAEIAAMKSELSWSRAQRKQANTAAGSPKAAISKSLASPEQSESVQSPSATQNEATNEAADPNTALAPAVTVTSPVTPFSTSDAATNSQSPHNSAFFSPQSQRFPVTPSSKQKMSGSVKMLSAMAKWQGKHNFKVCLHKTLGLISV
jgi:hypothetical protein